ncbi:MAG TPA: hypothetical protein V6C65_28025, partial [Allocoleopsis sp.]
MEQVEQEPDRQEPDRQEPDRQEAGRQELAEQKLVEQKPVEQIELPLWEVLQAATIDPEHADLWQLLSVLDTTLLQL